MVDAPQSLLDRLKNKSRSSGKSYQLILQLFCQEEFLRRLQYSRYRENFILKGGLLIFCLSSFQGRPTQDIDFLLKNLSSAEDSITGALKEIFGSLDQIVNFELLRLEPIAEHREYNGIRARLIARIKNTRTPFNVDMGVGDIIVPGPEIKTIPTQLDGMESPSVYVYSLESIISEKFDAIISRLELTSRMKDYYDIYYLAITCPFNGRTLQQAISETLRQRRTTCYASILKDINGFAENSDMLTKWRHFTKKTLKVSIEFKDVIEVIVKLTGPPFDAIMNKSELLREWNPETRAYEPGK